MDRINLAGIKYYVTAMLSDGTQLQLENVVENLAWEENENEISVRLNLTLRDIPYEKTRLAAMLPLCTAIYVYYSTAEEGKRIEVFRGTVWEWEHSDTHNDAIVLTCYDMLYYLQKSTDSKYYAKGKTTKAICEDILTSWNVPVGAFTGPSFTHEKTLYKSKTISAMLEEALEEAKKKTGKKGVIRANEGKCDIVTQGENADVWGFNASTNLVEVQDKYSMVNLVTRIIITGKDDKEGRPKVEATLDGKTEYGILQQYKSMGSAKLEDAKKEAQEVLDEKGKPERTITLQAPDAPWVRKGDKINVTTDTLKGDFYVLGISHNATSGTMQMEVEAV